MNHLYCQQFNQGNSNSIPLVMLHGFLGESDDWQDIVKQLPSTISCYGIDLPGHGKSKNVLVDQDSGFAQCSELISATLAKHGISTYLLLGYSLGGRIALYHASQNPQQVKGLILESCHFGLDDYEQKQQRIANDTVWANKFSSHNLPEVLTSWYQQDVFNSLSQAQKNSLVTMRSQLTGSAISSMLLATSLGKQPQLTIEIANSNIASYYLFGENDLKYQDIGKTFKQKYPKLNIIKHTQSGHNIHFEQPIRFSNSLIEIYTELSSKFDNTFKFKDLNQQ